MEYGQVVCLREQPSLLEKAACWFSDKWGIPTPAYRESMADCISRKTEIPQWYIVLNEEGDIIAGAGVIENDFHDRKDLAPNLCALFVEEAYRESHSGLCPQRSQKKRDFQAVSGDGTHGVL